MRIETKEKLEKVFNIFLVIASVIMCCIIAFNLTHVKIVVDGISMNPTISDKETGYMQKVFKNSKLERFDVVAVEITNETNYIKRIVGLPGETVSIKGDEIYINGIIIEQPFDVVSLENNHRFDGDYVLDENQYFILGDNHKYTVPPIKITKDQIKAKNGFIVGDCKQFDGVNCQVKERKKWRKING